MCDCFYIHCSARPKSEGFRGWGEAVYTFVHRRVDAFDAVIFCIHLDQL